MRRFIPKHIFLLLCFFSSALISLAQTTVDFNSYGANQGLPSPHVEVGLQFEAIYSDVASAFCINGCIGIDFNEGKDGSPGLDEANQAANGVIGWAITGADNAAFQFISIWVNDRGPYQQNPPGSSTQGTIKAFKGGVQVGAAKTLVFNSSSIGVKSYGNDPDFYDVDSVLIEGADLFLILDEITYDAPLVVGDADPAEVTAINLVGSPLSTATSVQYQVDFSKPAKNVLAGDFILTTTGTATGTIGAPTPPGGNATFTVPISGISGEGTLRLDLKTENSIANENDVEGTAAFTSGQVHNVSPCLVEGFEDETVGTQMFSNGGFNFTITGNLEVRSETPTIGINGSRYALKNTGVGPYIINSNTSDINLRKFAVYLSSIADGGNVTTDGSITVTGKKDGNTVYTVTKSTGFPLNNTGTLKGYSYLDLATEGGSDNSIKSVDQIEITLGGAFQYINIDNFEFCADDVAPSGYTVMIDQDPIKEKIADAVSFTFADAEIGATFDYSFSSVGGGTDIAGSGTIATANDQITGIDLSGLGVGTVSLLVTLTDPSGNEGGPATDTKQKLANNVPVATSPTAPFVIEDDTNVALADNIQVEDGDGDDQTLTFTITGGTVTLGATGITFGGSGNGSSSFTAAGTLVALNTALDAASFTPIPGLVGTDAGTIAFVANDGLADSNTASVTFDIASNNNPPIAQAQNLYAPVQVNCIAPIPAIFFNNNSSDPDGDDLTFTAIPAGPYPVGVTEVILSVSDGVLTTQADPVTITVYSDAPTIEGITPGATSLSVDFTPATPRGGLVIINYEYSIDNGANWINLNPSKTSGSILIQGLISATTYQVQLRAVYDQGVSCGSAMVEATTTSAIPSAFIEVTPGTGLGASTFGGSDSFIITNNSTGGIAISGVSIDLSTTILRDMVFDPKGLMGEANIDCFNPNSAQATAVGLDVFGDNCVDPFAGPRQGGFDLISLNFTDFNPGEVFSFSADVDPNSIEEVSGAGSPEAVSGFELVGATITVTFSDGSSIAGSLFEDGSLGGSQAVIAPGAANSPAIFVDGIPSLPATVTGPNQTIVVSGNPGDHVALLQTDSRLFIESGEPPFNVSDPVYYGNEVMSKALYNGVIGGGGTLNIPITMLTSFGTDGNPGGGLNQFVAVTSATPIALGQQISGISNVITLLYPDTEDPVINNCPGNIQVSNVSGTCGALVTWTPPMATDNRGSVTLESNFEPGAIFPVGETLLTYIATDGAGNSVNCSFTVTVNDIEAPVFGTVTDITVKIPSTQSETNVLVPKPFASDNCSVTVAGERGDGKALGDSYPVGETLITWSAEDPSGNRVHIPQNVIVELIPQKVIRFVMVNANTNEDLFEITEGMEIDFDLVNGVKLNIRVETNPATVGSVSMSMTGPVNASRTDNVLPYTVFEEKEGKGNNSGSILLKGDYAILAVPYTLGTNESIEGIPTVINFSIVKKGKKPKKNKDDKDRNNKRILEDNSEEGSRESVSNNGFTHEPKFGEFRMFPNPAQAEVNLEVDLDQSTHVWIRIFDGVGRLVYQEEGVQNGSLTYQINIDDLSPGYYVVQVVTDKLVMDKVLIKK